MEIQNTVSHHSFDALFRPIRIGPHHLSNRLVALPVFTGYAFPNGSVSPLQLRHYQELAASGVSMVVVANASVQRVGATSRHSLRVDSDEFIAGLSQLASIIHKDGALACLQLNHAGRFAKTEQPLLPSAIDGKNLAFNISALKDFMEFFPLEKRFQLTRNFLKMANNWQTVMTEDDRGEILKAFGDAAERAYRAGFDMIELHGANGYLLCQFLSAFTNPDDSGRCAGFQKRARFPILVIKEIQQRLPPNFPIGYRLILREWVPGGINLDEAIAFARLLQDTGCAYLSGSLGTFNSIFMPEVRSKTAETAYLKNDMKVLKQEVSIPTIISGRIIKPNIANQIIRENVADIVGLGRPLRTDPRWVYKAAGHQGKVRICIDCNDCLRRVILDEGFSCRRWPKLRRQRAKLGHKLLFHNNDILCIATGTEDLANIVAELGRLLPAKIEDPLKRRLKIVGLGDVENRDSEVEIGPIMLRQARVALDRAGLSDIHLSQVTLNDTSFYDPEVQNVISTENFGMILLCHREKDSWRTRLLYRERRKIIGLLGSNQRFLKILVPVDLSDTTLLLLEFLKRFYLQSIELKVRFIHVSTDSERTVRQRWKIIMQICNLASVSPSLKLIPLRGDIASSIMDVVRREEVGTIVMGKRGLSGIKRWLLGSVSVGVLRRLTDQSLYLID